MKLITYSLEEVRVGVGNRPDLIPVRLRIASDTRPTVVFWEVRGHVRIGFRNAVSLVSVLN